MALYEYMYFKKAESLSALPNPNSYLSGCMPSEAISSDNRQMSGLVGQDTGQNMQQDLDKYESRSTRLFLRNEKPFFLPLESILIQALGFKVSDEAG